MRATWTMSIALVAALFGETGGAEALDYTKGSVRLVLSTDASAAPDIIARIVVESLSERRGLAKKISEDLRAVMAEPAMRKPLQNIASYPMPMSPAELGEYIRGEQALCRPVIEKILA